MTDPKYPVERKTPVGAVVTSTRMDMLKYEMFSLISGEELTASDVQRLADVARKRFGPDMIWSIGAANLHRIHKDARTELTKVFDEFRSKGGLKIIVLALDGFVGSPFQICALNAGNASLKIVKSAGEVTEEVKRTREAHPIKPVPAR